MTLVLVAAFLLLPFLELAVIVAMAGSVGLGWTFLLLVAFSVLGALVIRREGAAVWRTLDAELAAGRMPTRALVDGTMVLFGGVLLLTPGFLTDVAGLLLVLPPTRALLRPALTAALARRGVRRLRATRIVFGRGPVVDARSTWAGSADATPGPGGRASARVIDVQVNRTDDLR